MALIVKRGRLPKTPHTEFYAKPGVLALEEIHGSYGFSGPFSRKMHVRRYPTEQCRPPARSTVDLKPAAADDLPLQPIHVRTGRIPYGEDLLRARKALFFGAKTVVSVA